MSLQLTEHVRFQPFEGSEDPSLPIRYWQCSVNSTGDATGGVHTLSHALVPPGQPDPSLWSVEQVGFQHDATTTLSVLFTVINMLNRNDPSTPITVTVIMQGLSGLNGRVGPDGRAQTFLPFFVGSAAGREAAAGLSVHLVIANTNAVAFRSALWGYRWGGRAFYTPTGPRKPIGGVFGR